LNGTITHTGNEKRESAQTLIERAVWRNFAHSFYYEKSLKKFFYFLFTTNLQEQTDIA
jgi:hypothetical protein